jgi:rhodanese-related sulfurtransferase
MKKLKNIGIASLVCIMIMQLLAVSIFALPQEDVDTEKGKEKHNIEKREEKKEREKKRNDECKKISPLEAKDMLEKDDTIILLDVRTVEEYAEKHIAKSTNLPIDQLEAKAAEIIPDKEATIIVYCKLGKRSRKAVGMLSKMGYKNVYNLGGIEDWPYETEK